MSAQAEAGNVKIVRGLWNDGFLRELENFPTGKHDDCVDGLSGAHSILCNSGQKFEAETFRLRENVFKGMDALGGCRDRFKTRGAWY